MLCCLLFALFLGPLGLLVASRDGGSATSACCPPRRRRLTGMALMAVALLALSVAAAWLLFPGVAAFHHICSFLPAG